MMKNFKLEGSEGALQLFGYHLRRYFVTGLVVIVPIWGTYLILKALFLTLDGITAGFLRNYGLYYPGLGILILVLLILLAGVMATNIIGYQIFLLWERLLNRVPIVKSVYSLVKSIVDTFSGKGSEKFNRVVLVEFKKGGYTFGFVTGSAPNPASAAEGEKMINVFVPTTPNPTAGFILVVPEESVIPLDVSVEEGMKMILSLGMYRPPQEEAVVSEGEERAAAKPRKR
jgi:uncharacterized membrane protein